MAKCFYLNEISKQQSDSFLASLFSYILKNTYIGLPELINIARWSFPPVNFHRGLFLPASETGMSLTKAAAFSDFVSSGVARILNVCDANQPT